MNYTHIKFKIQLLKCLLFKREKKGFTLIELLVVMIILGVLVSVSLPNFINQIGKARETEAKNNLGAIARSQQAYHFENRTFADNMNKLTLNGSFSSKYYNFPDPSIVNSTIVKHKATAIDPISDQVRNYATGIYYNASLFDITLCQSKDINEDVDVPDTPSGVCTNDGIRLE
jgi:type IV pilus assembly protein PilA